jgi:DNA polymerase-3 subunit epsilon
VIKYPVISSSFRLAPEPNGQLSLEDMGTPLPEVTFCVIDLETTGGSAEHSRITEIGAVTYRGGERLGTFQTFVNPECEIPPSITLLTGITQSMVMRAPTIREVLPSLLEFIGEAVVVAHNARFDVSFINAALMRDDRPPLANGVLDTVALSRRLVRGMVPDCKLATLAKRLRLPHQPSHRALDDALATGDLLHFLIEQATSYGVVGLDDLATLTKLTNHPQAAKLALTDDLPRSPGVYLFVGDGDTVLYVGKATNLRHRVRSYFSTAETRRKVQPLLRQVRAVHHVPTPDTLTAGVYETRLIARLLPQYNNSGTRWDKYRYLRVGIEADRLVTTNTRKIDRPSTYIGPLSSRSLSTLVAEAIESVLPRFDERIDTRRALDDLITAITHHPDVIAHVLDARMGALAAAQRFEDAALVRDRLQAFTQAIGRQQLNEQLRRAGTLEVRIGDVVHHIDHGIVVETRGHDALFDPLRYAATSAQVLDALHAPEPPTALDLPIPTAVVDEVSLVARHLTSRGALVEQCSGEWSSPIPVAQSALGDSWRTASQKSISGSSGSIASDDVVTPLAK